MSLAPGAELDSPWKEALEQYFQPVLALCFPHVHAGIAWSRGYEFLDTELQRVVRDAELGRRLADKLAKVWRRDGEEAWVLVHVEVQSQPDPGFAERMYVYNYRLFDRYHRPVVSLGVLGDEDPRWRPARFLATLWECEVSLRFPIVKLLDYAGDWEALMRSESIFAVVIMAHLQAQTTRLAPEPRLAAKLRLARLLYERGYGRDDVLALLRFIDWMLALPEDLEQGFRDTLEQYEEEFKMPYVTSYERLAREEGRQEGREEGRQEGCRQTLRESVLEILESRFGVLPSELIATVHGIDNPERLRRLRRAALAVATLDQFREELSSTGA